MLSKIGLSRVSFIILNNPRFLSVSCKNSNWCIISTILAYVGTLIFKKTKQNALLLKAALFSGFNLESCIDL